MAEFEISEPENCDGPPCSVLVGDYYGARDYSFIGFIDEIYIFDYVPLDITNLPCNMHFFLAKENIQSCVGKGEVLQILHFFFGNFRVKVKSDGVFYFFFSMLYL